MNVRYELKDVENPYGGGSPYGDLQVAIEGEAFTVAAFIRENILAGEIALAGPPLTIDNCMSFDDVKELVDKGRPIPVYNGNAKFVCKNMWLSRGLAPEKDQHPEALKPGAPVSSEE